MRYAATEKQEIIRTVEDSSLGIRRMLRQLSIPKSTFYHWYDRYLTGGGFRRQEEADALHQLEPSPRGDPPFPGGASLGSARPLTPGASRPVHG